MTDEKNYISENLAVDKENAKEYIRMIKEALKSAKNDKPVPLVVAKGKYASDYMNYRERWNKLLEFDNEDLSDMDIKELLSVIGMPSIYSGTDNAKKYLDGLEKMDPVVLVGLAMMYKELAQLASWNQEDLHRYIQTSNPSIKRKMMELQEKEKEKVKEKIRKLNEKGIFVNENINS